MPMTRRDRLEGRRSGHTVQEVTIITVPRLMIVSQDGRNLSVHPCASILFDFVF